MPHCNCKKSRKCHKKKQLGCGLSFCSQANLIPIETEVLPIIQSGQPISFPIAVAKAKGMKIVNSNSVFMRRGPIRVRVVLNPLPTISEQEIIIELKLDGQSIPFYADSNQTFSSIVDENPFELESIVQLPHSGNLQVYNSSLSPIILGQIPNSTSIGIDESQSFSVVYFEAAFGNTG